jgi:protein SCO1
MAKHPVSLLSRVALGLAVVTALAACDRLKGGDPAAANAPKGPKPSFVSIDITGADYANALSLTDADGKRRTLADFKGKVTVVFFGYTQCPDVCPTTMSELAAVKKELGADGARVQGIFITVDPERDKPAMLKEYVGAFDPDFIALTGTPDEIKAVSRNFKVFYAKVIGKTEGSYLMDHTAGSYIFDTQGKVRLFSRYGAGAPALVKDIKVLLAEAP